MIKLKKPAKPTASKTPKKAAPAKPKPAKAKSAKKKVAVKKTGTVAKPAKVSKSPKAKKLVKPKKPTGTKLVSLIAAPPASALLTPIASPVVARPQISSPLANANIPAGDLIVTMTSNQTGFRYRLELTDITPPAPAPAPVTFNVPAPGCRPSTLQFPERTSSPGAITASAC